MVAKINQNSDEIKDGDFVIFITGEKSVNTFPSYIRVGKVLSFEKREVLDLNTNKTYKLYTNQIFKAGKKIQSVKSQLVFVDETVY